MMETRVKRMTRDELIQRLVGRTIVGVGFERGDSNDDPRIGTIKLDGGENLVLYAQYDPPDDDGIDDAYIAFDFEQAPWRADPELGFAGSMWGQSRIFDGVELVPRIVQGQIETLIVQAICADPPSGSHVATPVLDFSGLLPGPIATKVDTSAIEKAWLGRPYSDWLALPR